jgi:AmmeMemoRadiSam system protein A
MHPLVELARRTVEEYVRTGHMPDAPAESDEAMASQAGVFVSLKKHGNLRGCIGTFLPQYGNVASEIIHNAVSAATRDPRFAPVTQDELDDIDYSVDVLTTPEPVKSMDELDPKRYGVIVTLGHRRGLLLPDLEGVDTVEHQLGIAMSKAGIDPSEADDVQIERFEVRRYK